MFVLVNVVEIFPCDSLGSDIRFFAQSRESKVGPAICTQF